MSRKNILILSHNYATQFIDVCNQYVQVFDPEKFLVTVAYLSGPPDETARKRTESEEVIFFDFKNKTLRGLKIHSVRKLLDFCRKKKFSLVICHRYKPIYHLLWVSKFIKIPGIFCVMHEMGTLSALSRRLLIALLAGKNFYFAGVSNAVRDDLRKTIWRVPPERVITLYNCIDMQAAEKGLLSRADARKFLDLPENAFVFGTIGRLEPAKDQKSMLEAFARIRDKCPNAFLIIMGNGSLEKILQEEVSRLGLTDHVRLTGFVPEAWRYLKALDVFLLTSVKEAFGRVLPEAMTAKIPLIGTRVNGIPEVIGDAGILIEPRDVEGLTNAMLRYYHLSADEIKQWGDKEYTRVREQFSYEYFHQEFMKYAGQFL